MLNRYRAFVYAPERGTTVHVPSGAVTEHVTSTGQSECYDSTGYYPAAMPLTIQKDTLSPGTITGQTPFPIYRFDKRPYLNQPGMPVVPITSNNPTWGWMGDGPPSDNDAIQQVLASTIPTRPEVSVPNLLWELFPSNMRDAGRIVASRPFKSGLQKDRDFYRKKHGPKESPKNSVAEINFGWVQLYRDLTGLLKFQEHVEKRDRELQSLYEKGGLKRKRVVWSGHTDYISAHNLVVNSVECFVEVDRRTQKQVLLWVTVRWVYPYDKPIPTDSERLQQARLLVHGWSNAPARVWEALPWSWFIDYFAGIGNFLEVSNNSLGVYPTNICVCRQEISTISDTIVGQTEPSWFSVTPGTFKRVLKTRTIGSFGLATHIPILSGSQLTTLAGIAANYGG